MSVCIFLGPTLPIAEARQMLDADYRPPAAHGDIYRASLQEPKLRAIGIIDGYFRQRPAVRHKEILWALSQGIQVFGAASIGALRAAELADFGMIGIGRIFEDFRAGRLEDDDEVAVDHGPAELGYPAINEAMVDIRAYLAGCRAEGAIAEATESTLLDLAKQSFYPDRNLAALAEQARRCGVPQRDLDRLLEIPAPRRASAKRDDAVKLLEAVNNFTRSRHPVVSVDFLLERTEFWEADLRAMREKRGSNKD